MKNKKTKTANIGHSNKLVRKIFEIRLKHKLKKCSNAELQIILIEANLEYRRRFKNK